MGRLDIRFMRLVEARDHQHAAAPEAGRGIGGHFGEGRRQDVGEDQVEGGAATHQRRPVAGGDAAGDVRPDPVRRRVPLRHLDRHRVAVDCDDLGVRAEFGDRHGQDPAAGADVGDAQRVPPGSGQIPHVPFHRGQAAPGGCVRPRTEGLARVQQQGHLACRRRGLDMAAADVEAGDVHRREGLAVLPEPVPVGDGPHAGARGLEAGDARCLLQRADDLRLRRFGLRDDAHLPVTAIIVEVEGHGLRVAGCGEYLGEHLGPVRDGEPDLPAGRHSLAFGEADETGHHAFPSGIVEVDDKLGAIDRQHLAVPQLRMDDTVPRAEVVDVPSPEVLAAGTGVRRRRRRDPPPGATPPEAGAVPRREPAEVAAGGATAEPDIHATVQAIVRATIVRSGSTRDTAAWVGTCTMKKAIITTSTTLDISPTP